MTYDGVRFVTSDRMVEAVEDWSDVRSPSRARRRLAMGHPQNIRIIYQPRKDALRVGDGPFIMHPEALAAVSASLDRLSASFDSAAAASQRFEKVKLDENA